MAEQSDPRQVGGVYRSGYWQAEYRVDAIEHRDGVTWFSVTWLADGHATDHCTGWDHRRDRVVSQPA